MPENNSFVIEVGLGLKVEYILNDFRSYIIISPLSAEWSSATSPFNRKYYSSFLKEDKYEKIKREKKNRSAGTMRLLLFWFVKVICCACSAHISVQGRRCYIYLSRHLLRDRERREREEQKVVSREWKRIVFAER